MAQRTQPKRGTRERDRPTASSSAVGASAGADASAVVSRPCLSVRERPGYAQDGGVDTAAKRAGRVQGGGDEAGEVTVDGEWTGGPRSRSSVGGGLPPFEEGVPPEVAQQHRRGGSTVAESWRAETRKTAGPSASSPPPHSA